MPRQTADWGNMSFADKVSLEMDGMKSPMEGTSAEESSEPKDEKATEAHNGEMAIAAIKADDGEAFEEAIKAIMSGL